MTKSAYVKNTEDDFLHFLSLYRRHGGHVGGTTQRNILLVSLSDPAVVGG